MGATRRLQTTVDGNCVAVNAEEAAKKRRRRRRRNRKQKRQHKMTVEVGLSSAYGTCSIVASNVVVVVAVVRMPSPSLHFAAERIHYSKCYLCKHLTIRNAQAIV